MRRFSIAVVVLALARSAACRWLLPERYAVNAPIGQHALPARHRGPGARRPSPRACTFRRASRSASSQTGLANARFLRPTAAGDLLVSVPRDGPRAPARARRRRRRPLRRRAHAARGPQPPAWPRHPRRLALRGRGQRDRARPLRCGRAHDASGAYERDRHGPSRAGATTGRARCASVPTACSTCPSARAATSASSRIRGAPRCCASSPTASHPRDPRHRAAQLGRLRLAAGDRRALRHRQRPRPARRRLPAVRAQPHRCRAASTAGPSRTATACPIPISATGTTARIAQVDPAGARLPRAQRAARHGVPAQRRRRRGVSRRGAGGAARLLEPHARRTATRS